MGCPDIINRLLVLFGESQERGDYASIKIWTGDDGNVKFFFTNTPPKTQHKSDHCPSQVLPNTEIDHQQSTRQLRSKSKHPVNTNQQKKRKISEKSITVSPEKVRSESIEVEEDALNVSVIDDERSNSIIQPSVPCSNRFSILEDLTNYDNTGMNSAPLTTRAEHSIIGKKGFDC